MFSVSQKKHVTIILDQSAETFSRDVSIPSELAWNHNGKKKIVPGTRFPQRKKWKRGVESGRGESRQYHAVEKWQICITQEIISRLFIITYHHIVQSYCTVKHVAQPLSTQTQVQIHTYTHVHPPPLPPTPLFNPPFHLFCDSSSSCHSTTCQLAPVSSSCSPPSLHSLLSYLTWAASSTAYPSTHDHITHLISHNMKQLLSNWNYEANVAKRWPNSTVQFARLNNHIHLKHWQNAIVHLIARNLNLSVLNLHQTTKSTKVLNFVYDYVFYQSDRKLHMSILDHVATRHIYAWHALIH